jgi:hypothetical protein
MLDMGPKNSPAMNGMGSSADSDFHTISEVIK